SALHKAAERMGIGIPPVSPPECERAINRDGAVSLPGRTESDPQATFYAVELGCADARLLAVSPHSRAGWPNQRAIDDSLGTSVAALQVASEIGMANHFTAQLERQGRSVWLPALQRDTSPPALRASLDRARL